MKTFRELTVWQRSHELVLAIYRATTSFPSREQYGLVSQMRRAAVSVAANIVEGHKRKSRKEFLNFLDTADSSLEELKYYLTLAKDLHYLASELCESLYREAETVGRMLSGLKKYVRQQVANALPQVQLRQTAKGVSADSRRISLVVPSLLLTSLLLTSRLVSAQSTNGAVTLVQDTVASAGGRVGGGNPMSLVTALGEPIGGLANGGSLTIRSGYAPSSAPPAPGSKLIAVEGTVNEPVSSVIVNGLSAVITGLSFLAEGIVLNEGPNTVTVTATDLAGNSATRTITVVLDTHPPARPTAVIPPALTTETSQVLSGTKMPGTSVWINGAEVVPLSDATSWTAIMSLVEGDNVFVIVTKDAAGNTSANVTVRIIVDNLPPVVTFQPVAKTNFTPILLAGSVDDSLTTVAINGTTATRTGRTFELSVPLTLGPNVFHLVATSPRGLITERDVTITLGTIPAIQTIQPADAAKVYAGTTTTIQVVATDQEGDAVSYQVRVDGTPLGTWSATPSQPWTPGMSGFGLHTLTLMVRDEYGGSNTQDIEVFVVRQPVQHP